MNGGWMENCRHLQGMGDVRRCSLGMRNRMIRIRNKRCLAFGLYLMMIP